MKRQKNTRKEDRNLTFTLFNHQHALERDRESLIKALLILLNTFQLNYETFKVNKLSDFSDSAFNTTNMNLLQFAKAF